MLNRNQGASLSEVAEHVGLTLPSVSKMVDGLVTRGLLTRATDPGDRRRLTLSLTPAGAHLHADRLCRHPGIPGLAP